MLNFVDSPSFWLLTFFDILSIRTLESFTYTVSISLILLSARRNFSMLPRTIVNVNSRNSHYWD